MGKGLRDIIGLPELFDSKPVIIRAFQSAKNRIKATNPHAKDDVSHSDLLSYLLQYYEYWIAFGKIDK